MGKAKSNDKRAAAEILQARIVQLTQKFQEAANKATQTKEQYEELTDRIREMKEEGVNESELKIVVERQQQRGRENQQAYEEFKRIQARITELQDMVNILTGKD